jgi:Cdc6-like AAA superfamily ATPase
LSPPDPSTNQSKVLHQRFGGTRQWFINSETLTSFKEGNVPFLWLNGTPGRGKTILSSSIIDALQQNSNTVPALLFYFDFNDNRKQSLSCMLRSLIWQLFGHSQDSDEGLVRLYKFCNNGREQPSTKSLAQALEGMSHKCKVVRTILDALDECTTRQDLLNWIKGLIESTSNFYVICTSRKELDIDSHFSTWTDSHARISVRNAFVDADIQLYVRARTRSDEGLNRWREMPEIQEKIELELFTKADGMYVKDGLLGIID